MVPAQMFQTFMHDEAALLRAARAEWALVPLSYTMRGTEPTEEPAVHIGEVGITVGRHADNQIVCDSPMVPAPLPQPVWMVSVRQPPVHASRTCARRPTFQLRALGCLLRSRLS
jgi:hypothetical protein